MRDALEQRRQSVMYIWQKGEGNQDYTQMVGSDWAICIPLEVAEGSGAGQRDVREVQPGDTAESLPHIGDRVDLPEQLGLYLSGTLPTAGGAQPENNVILRSDLKFTELVADIFGALRKMGGLQRQLGQLRNFLPHDVVNAMGTKPPDQVEEMLRPRVVEVTVLFCDIRGSSRLAELGQDNLLRLWDNFSGVLEIMTRSVRNEGGIIANLQGDAIMAFWGWPLQDASFLARPLRAALAICERLARVPADSPLGRIRCGIGIAHGNAVVGRLGTPDQFKIDAFGPTVNLAARLEALAKFFGVNIVVDRHTSTYLVGKAEEVGGCVRQLGLVQPAGMNLIEEVAELAMPAAADGSGTVRGSAGRSAGAERRNRSTFRVGPASLPAEALARGAHHPGGTAKAWRLPRPPAAGVHGWLPRRPPGRLERRPEAGSQIAEVQE